MSRACHTLPLAVSPTVIAATDYAHLRVASYQSHSGARHDGFGRSDSRDNFDFFEVNRFYVTLLRSAHWPTTV